jgi:chaperonin cofactor prefoldin
MTRSISGRCAAQFAVFAVLLARALDAQQTPPAIATAVPTPSAIPASAADTSEVILTARLVDTIRIEKDRFLGERRDAESRWTTLRDEGDKLRGQIAELKEAISAVNAKEKLAKKDKRDTDRIAAAAEKRQLERSLELIEARFALRRAQIEKARMERDYLDAAIRADDAELSIAERQTQVTPDDPSQRSVFQELTSRWLQALRTRTARAYDLEDRRFKVVEAQIDLLKLQRG